jgi:hypothetical protein
MKMRNIAAFIIAFISTVFSSQINLSRTISAEYYNEPLESCLVRLMPISPTAKADSSQTDSTGQYRFTNAWPGVYVIIADKSEYLADSQDVVIDASKVVDFRLLKTDHSWSTDLPDTLKKINSPFFITDSISIDHSPVIENGVYLYIKGTMELNGQEVMAVGNSSDTIRFIGLGAKSCIKMSSSSLYFTACSFKKINQFQMIRLSITLCQLQGYKKRGAGRYFSHTTISPKEALIYPG